MKLQQYHDHLLLSSVLFNVLLSMAQMFRKKFVIPHHIGKVLWLSILEVDETTMSMYALLPSWLRILTSNWRKCCKTICTFCCQQTYCAPFRAHGISMVTRWVYCKARHQWVKFTTIWCKLKHSFAFFEVKHHLTTKLIIIPGTSYGNR